jgi:hypothetical protein
MTVAISGAGAMPSSSARMPPPRLRSTSLEGFHCSRCRRVTSKRQSVRRIASTLKKASYGRQATLTTARWSCRRLDRPTCTRCVSSGMSTGQANTSRNAGSSTGSAHRLSSQAVQASGAGENSQPSTSNATVAAGTRLRRRLSSSLPRESQDNGLRSNPPSRRGTHGSSQGSNCQSPRIQR